MTAQVPDRLVHRGKVLPLCATPLYDYVRRLPKHRRPQFRSTSTTNWRGYIATWEIIEQRLFLTGIEDAVIDVDGEPHETTLQTIFPRRSHPVLATWVSGELRCPEGRLRSYVHAGFASKYERDRVFFVEKGTVVEEWLVHNPPSPLHYLIDPNGKRTYATALTTQALAPDEDPFPGDVPIKPWKVWGRRDWEFETDEDEEYLIAAWVEFA